MSESFDTLAGTDDWLTPPEVVAALKACGGVALDPCHSAESLLDAEYIIDVTDGGDGLREDWFEIDGIVYVNPPFSDLRSWVAKCATESAKGAHVLLLMPMRLDTVAVHEHILGNDHARMLAFKGRLGFHRSLASLERELAAAKLDTSGAGRRKALKLETRITFMRGTNAKTMSFDKATFATTLVHWLVDPEAKARVEHAFAPLGAWLRPSRPGT